MLYNLGVFFTFLCNVIYEVHFFQTLIERNNRTINNATFEFLELMYLSLILSSFQVLIHNFLELSSLTSNKGQVNTAF